MAATVVGRDGDLYLVADGPAGAIVTDGAASPVRDLQSFVAHGDFDPFDGPLPGGMPAGLDEALAAKRAEMEGPALP